MRPGTFTQIYIQIVFAVSNRQSLITPDIREEVFRYMGGILNSQNHKTLIVNGVSNHAHIFLGLNPDISISDTVHDLKRSSSLYINKEKLTRQRFSWQAGYGAFSYSRSHLEKVVNYIKNQEIHHSHQTFKEEYVKFLRKYEIDHDERFLFSFDDIV